MPSSSKKQRAYIFYLRGKYKNKENTPEKYKFIWDDEWKKVEETMLQTYKSKYSEEDLKSHEIEKLYLRYWNWFEMKINQIRESDLEEKEAYRSSYHDKPWDTYYSGSLFTVEVPIPI